MTTKFMFLRDKNRNPVACIATNYDKDTNKFTYQYSVVHSDDQFDKERGRQIALGRLTTNPMNVIESDFETYKQKHNLADNIAELFYYEFLRFNKNACPKINNKSYMESIVRSFAVRSSRVPTKLKNAAKLWIEQKEKTRFGIE